MMDYLRLFICMLCITGSPVMLGGLLMARSDSHRIQAVGFAMAIIGFLNLPLALDQTRHLFYETPLLLRPIEWLGFNLPFVDLPAVLVVQLAVAAFACCIFLGIIDAKVPFLEEMRKETDSTQAEESADGYGY